MHESLRVGLLLEPLGIGREALAKERMSLANSDGSSHLKDTLKNQKEMIAIAPGSLGGQNDGLPSPTVNCCSGYCLIQTIRSCY